VEYFTTAITTHVFKYFRDIFGKPCNSYIDSFLGNLSVKEF